MKALSLSGIGADFSGKNDILVQGYKISGNAFFVEEDILCHHGTLLLDVDLEKMSSILTVSQHKLQSKGIDSVKSRVKNLRELNEEMSVESLKVDLIDTFSLAFDAPFTFRVCEEVTDDGHINLGAIHELVRRYESWEWNFGSSPEFNMQITERFSWGEVDLYLLVRNGIITETEVNTDALDIDLPQKIKDKICNMKFDYHEVISIISNCSNVNYRIS